MQYKVSGARRDTGDVATMTVEASSPASAERKANRRGLLVDTCTLIPSVGAAPSVAGVVSKQPAKRVETPMALRPSTIEGVARSPNSPKVETTLSDGVRQRRTAPIWAVVAGSVAATLLVGGGAASLLPRLRAVASHSTATFDGPNDLFGHPELLRDRSKSASDFTLKGIHIGDDRAKVVALSGRPDDGGDTVGTTGLFNFGVHDGRVDAFYLSDKDWLKRAGVLTTDEALATLGPPTAIRHPGLWLQLMDMAKSQHQPEPPADEFRELQYRDRHFTFFGGPSPFLQLTVATPGFRELNGYAVQCQPFVDGLRSLNSKAEVGLNLSEYRGLVQQLAEVREPIGAFPPEWDSAKAFSQTAQLAFDMNRHAVSQWANSGFEWRTDFKEALKANVSAMQAYQLMNFTK